jgi:hypothetical protein
MNNNSEYDDVVSELENELLNCGVELEPEEEKPKQQSEVELMVMNMNRSLNARNVYDDLLNVQQQASSSSSNNHVTLEQLTSGNGGIHNEDDIEDLIYENYLLSESFIEDMNQTNRLLEESEATAAGLLNTNSQMMNGASGMHNITSDGQQHENAVSSNTEKADNNNNNNNNANGHLSSWRRELEQVLIADSSETSNNNANSMLTLSTTQNETGSADVASSQNYYYNEGSNDMRDDAEIVDEANAAKEEGEDECDFDEMLSRALNNQPQQQQNNQTTEAGGGGGGSSSSQNYDESDEFSLL